MITSSKIIGVEVIWRPARDLNPESGRWTWVKGGRRRYKSNAQLRGTFGDDLEAARDCIRRAARSTWWDWPAGSRPFFWRWPKEYWESSRDGRKNYIRDKLPINSVPQTPVQVEFRDRVKSKVISVLDKGYIKPNSNVKSLTHFFQVPKTWKDGPSAKVVDEIRMVYDATKSGLNDSVWAPWFQMPTVESHLRSVEAGTYMADCDVGEMFLNFMLEPRLRLHAGVDLSKIFLEGTPDNLLAFKDSSEGTP